MEKILKDRVKINGVNHRRIEYVESHKVYYYENQGFHLHREDDGPAVIARDRYEWYKMGRLHRINGPAVEYTTGRQDWYEDGRRHRLDGPAVIYADGSEFWYKKGLRHRDDGPAVIPTNGGRLKWFINGLEYTEQQFNEKIEKDKKNEIR